MSWINTWPPVGTPNDPGVTDTFLAARGLTGKVPAFSVAAGHKDLRNIIENALQDVYAAAIAAQPAGWNIPPIAPGSARAPLVVDPFTGMTSGGYYIPVGTANVKTVSTTTALETALNINDNAIIVVNDGTYDKSSQISWNGGPHLVVSRHGPGTVFITCGMLIGSNSAPGPAGSRICGINFTASDPSKCGGNKAQIDKWNNSNGVTFTDCIFDGGANMDVDHGVFALDPRGLRIQRFEARNFNSTGIRFDDNSATLQTYTTPVIITDGVIEHIWGVANDGFNTRGGGGPGRGFTTGTNRGTGTDETAIHAGQTCIVERVDIRDCGWMGILTANSCLGSKFRHIRLRDTRNGIYLEHTTRNNLFEDFTITGAISQGIIIEWMYDVDGAPTGTWANYRGSKDCTFQKGYISARDYGIVSQAGTLRMTFQDLTITDTSQAGIWVENNDGTIIRRCDFSGKFGGPGVYVHDTSFANVGNDESHAVPATINLTQSGNVGA